MRVNIESSAFGVIVINGKKYTSDVLIFPDGRIRDKWWRKSGHRLCIDDIEGLVASEPEVIVIGRGVNGLMRPEPGLEKVLMEKGIQIKAEKNPEAIEIYNATSSQKRTAACFHLTC